MKKKFFEKTMALVLGLMFCMLTISPINGEIIVPDEIVLPTDGTFSFDFTVEETVNGTIDFDSTLNMSEPHPIGSPVASGLLWSNQNQTGVNSRYAQRVYVDVDGRIENISYYIQTPNDRDVVSFKMHLTESTHTSVPIWNTTVTLTNISEDVWVGVTTSVGLNVDSGWYYIIWDAPVNGMYLRRGADVATWYTYGWDGIDWAGIGVQPYFQMDLTTVSQLYWLTSSNDNNPFMDISLSTYTFEADTLTNVTMTIVTTGLLEGARITLDIMTYDSGGRSISRFSLDGNLDKLGGILNDLDTIGEDEGDFFLGVGVPIIGIGIIVGLVVLVAVILKFGVKKREKDL